MANTAKEAVRKIPNKAEADRVFNYPFAAAEESLVNAVYHKSYEQRNPVEFSIRRDRIEILSFPGPLPPIDNEALKSLPILTRDYRNRRIGDLLKELHLTEGRCTGIPKIAHAMEENGSSRPIFQTDDARSYFLVTLPVHPDFKKVQVEVKVEANVEAYDKAHDLTDTEKAILKLCWGKPQSLSGIAEKPGYAKVPGHLKRSMKKLLSAGIIKYTIPDKSRSRKQRYQVPQEKKADFSKKHD